MNCRILKIMENTFNVLFYWFSCIYNVSIMFAFSILEFIQAVVQFMMNLFSLVLAIAIFFPIRQCSS